MKIIKSVILVLYENSIGMQPHPILLNSKKQFYNKFNKTDKKMKISINHNLYILSYMTKQYVRFSTNFRIN